MVAHVSTPIPRLTRPCFTTTLRRSTCANGARLNAERLRDPVFRLFQGELEAVYEEKNMYADNLLASTAEKVQQYALAGTPYAYPIIGATDSLKNPRLSEMYRFFKTYYVPENMGLILCGDLSLCDDSTGHGEPMSALRELLERTFGQLTPSGRPMKATPTAKLRDFTKTTAMRLKPAHTIGQGQRLPMAGTDRTRFRLCRLPSDGFHAEQCVKDRTD